MLFGKGLICEHSVFEVHHCNQHFRLFQQNFLRYQRQIPLSDHILVVVCKGCQFGQVKNVLVNLKSTEIPFLDQILENKCSMTT